MKGLLLSLSLLSGTLGAHDVDVASRLHDKMYIVQDMMREEVALGRLPQCMYFYGMYAAYQDAIVMLLEDE